jgi:hypothetical protein
MAAPTLVGRRLDGPARRSAGWALPFQMWFPLVVYGLSRLIAAAFMVAASSAHKSGYAGLATAWDGDWYRLIALQGYPSSLPTGIDGHVEQNAWAFSPVYPLFVRAITSVTGLGFSVVAPALSVVLGAAAMVVIFMLLERAVSRFSACATVVLSCTFMAAPVLQLAYAESLALLLVAGALLLLRQRKYVAVAPSASRPHPTGRAGLRPRRDCSWREPLARDIHSRSGTRRADHAMGLGLEFPGRSSAVGSVSLTISLVEEQPPLANALMAALQ